MFVLCRKLFLVVLSLLYFSNLENEDASAIEMESLLPEEISRGKCGECV